MQQLALREKACPDCFGTGEKMALELSEDGELKLHPYRCGLCEGWGKVYVVNRNEPQVLDGSFV